MAVLKKDGVDSVGEQEDRNKDRYLTGRKRAELLKEYEDFLKDTMEHPEHFLSREEYVLFGEQLYLLPPQMPELKGLKILRPGLHMGTLKKKRFEPSHGLALALRKEDVKRWIDLPSNGTEVVRYLKGETLPLDGWGTAKDPESGKGKAEETPRGWGLVLTDGFSLGWCKFAGGMAKNHYPKGLRWM